MLGLRILAGVIYHSENPEKPGFAVVVAEAATGGEAAGGEQPAAESLGALLAKADVAKGQTAVKACAACHDFSKGGPNKVGPNLWDVVERPRASHEGYNYSDPMASKKGEPWTYDNLFTFLKAPKDMVPGTKMAAFGGIKKDQARADVLAYLATLSDAPKPFPAP